MKKITMLALFASALEFASLDAMIEKKLSSENVSKDGFAAIEVSQEYDYPNGLIGIVKNERDLLFLLAEIINDEDKIKALFGMGDECFQWKDHPYFRAIRQNIFPNALDVREINEKIENHFSTLEGGCHKRTHGFVGGYTVGQDWSHEFFSLFYPNCTPDWKSENQDKVALIMDMSFDACLDKYHSPGLEPQEQAFYKEELYVRLHGRRWDAQRGFYQTLHEPINVDRLQELPYDLFLLVVTNWELCKYARFFSKNQFRWIPIQLIEKGDFAVIHRLCDNKDKLPKEHLVALDKRIDVLLEQWGIARDAAEADYGVAVNKGSFHVCFARPHRNDSLHMLDQVHELRKKYPKSCF
ncbi:hypothetical protein FACS1894122_03230 [Alphaproteobacteria bacterium]|nr:hypothetical protein FACS1894122_03230 [Alphaproteobacteria bacterium]